MNKIFIPLFVFPFSAFAASYCPPVTDVTCHVDQSNACKITADGWSCSCGGYNLPDKTMNILQRVTWSGKTESSKIGQITCHYAWQTTRDGMKVPVVFAVVTSDKSYQWSDVSKLAGQGAWAISAFKDPMTGGEAYSANCPATNITKPVLVKDCRLPLLDPSLLSD